MYVQVHLKYTLFIVNQRNNPNIQIVKFPNKEIDFKLERKFSFNIFIQDK